MTSNLKFNSDVDLFARALEEHLDVVLTKIALDITVRLQEVTPLRSGRAAASWNIAQGAPDLSVPPQILGERYWLATEAELEGARAYYQQYEARALAFEAEPGRGSVFVSNDLDYIEQLNAGSSRQAPPAFFEATVAAVESIAARAIAKANGGF